MVRGADLDRLEPAWTVDDRVTLEDLVLGTSSSRTGPWRTPSGQWSDAVGDVAPIPHRGHHRPLCTRQPGRRALVHCAPSAAPVPRQRNRHLPGTNGDCGRLIDDFTSHYRLLHGLSPLIVLIPGIVGVFWG